MILNESTNIHFLNGRWYIIFIFDILTSKMGIVVNCFDHRIPAKACEDSSEPQPGSAGATSRRARTATDATCPTGSACSALGAWPPSLGSTGRAVSSISSDDAQLGALWTSCRLSWPFEIFEFDRYEQLEGHLSGSKELGGL